MYQNVVTITKNSSGTWPDYIEDLGLTFFKNAINPQIDILILNLYASGGFIYYYPNTTIFANITNVIVNSNTWNYGLVTFTLNILGIDQFTKMDLLIRVSFDNKNSEVYTDQEYGFPYIYEDCSSTLLNNYFYNNKKCIEYTPYPINADSWTEKNEARITNFGVANDFTFNTYKRGTKPSFKYNFCSLVPSSTYSSNSYRIYKLARELEGGTQSKAREVLKIYSSTVNTSSGTQTDWTLVTTFQASAFKDKVIPKRIIVVIQGGGSSGRSRARESYTSDWAAGGGSGAVVVAVLDTSVDWLLRPGYGGRASGATVGDGWDSFVKTTDDSDIFIAGGGIVVGKTRGQKGTASSTITGYHSFLLIAQDGANGGFGYRGSPNYPAGNGGSSSIRVYATYNTADKFGYNELFETQTGGSKGAPSNIGYPLTGGGGASPFGEGGTGGTAYPIGSGQSGTLGSGGGGCADEGVSHKPGDGGDGFILLYY